ncbi:hypothetical protein Tco_0427330 [Tanacetum coccineum]
MQQVEDGPENENDEKDKSEDDSSPKEVNAVGQHVNTASPEVNTIKPTSIAKALSDSSWMEAMQEELLQSLQGGQGTLWVASRTKSMVSDEAVHKELGDRMERAATTASSLEAEQDNSNINRTQAMATLNGSIADEATFTSVDVDAGGAATTDIGLDAGQGSSTIHKTPTRPHDSPLPRVHTLRSDKGSLQQNELMVLVTKLTDRVELLENDMQQTKKVYSSALTKLILRMKKLEKKVKTNKARRRARIVISEDEDAGEDSSKQGRKISDIDKDSTVSLVHPEQDMEYDFDVSTAEGFTTASVPVTTASVTPEVSTATANLVYIRRSAEKRKDKGKAIMKDDKSDSEIEKEVMKRPGFNFQQKSSKKRSREDTDEDNDKKQRLEDDAEKKELRDSMDVVPRDDIAIDVESLATKYLIVDWKTHVLTENMMYYQIIRGDGRSKNYKIFSEMLDDFDRYDILDLHRLVQERYDITSPEGYDLLLWGDLKILFKPNEEDEIWKNQQDYNLISWRIFDTCGIHMLLMHTGLAIYMMIEKKYTLTQEMLSRMLSRRLEVDQESEMAYELLRSSLKLVISQYTIYRYNPLLITTLVLNFVEFFEVDFRKSLLRCSDVKFLDTNTVHTKNFLSGIDIILGKIIHLRSVPKLTPFAPVLDPLCSIFVIRMLDGYIAESDQKEILEEDSEEDPIDYTADTDDDGEDEEEEESSDDDEEEEHLAHAIALSAVDLVPSAMETELFETDESATTPPPPTAYRRGFYSFFLPTPPPSPLTPLSSPLPQIPSPPTHHPLPLPAPSTRRRADIPEAELPPQKEVYLLLPHLAMDAVESVNLRDNYQAGVHRWESAEFQTRHQDVKDDRAALCDKVDTLRRHLSSLCTTLEQERVQARQALDRTTRSTPATTTTTTTPMTDAQLKALINQGVVDALAARDTDRSRNGEDNHDSGMGVRRQAPLARECTYPDFMKCKPLYFKGTEGVIELTQWFERMEIVFHISNCTVENQIKFSTCTLLGSALTWWNSHVRTVGHDVAYAMTWTNLKKKMTDKYYPRGEIKKLKVEM